MLCAVKFLKPNLTGVHSKASTSGGAGCQGPQAGGEGNRGAKSSKKEISGERGPGVADRGGLPVAAGGRRRK